MNPHVSHATGPFYLLHSLYRNRDLILQMTKREVVGRYKGSVMGLAWSFFNPVLMLAVYTFVFSEVFNARWGSAVDAQRKGDFAIMLFVGMIVHGLFAECITRSPSVITSNINYVKKVVFPLEILPLVAFCASLFHSVIGLLVLMVAQLLINRTLPWTAVYYPLVALPLALGSMGFAWFLSSLGVFVRDVAQVTGIAATVLLFLSPVFFPVSALPDKYQFWMQLNPLTSIIEESRKVLVQGQSPDWAVLLAYAAISIAVAWAGFWWFQKTRKGFADVL